MRKVAKTIAIIDELDIDLYERLGIGVEIQDFTEPNLSDRDKRNRLREYKKIFKAFKGIKSLHGPFLDLKPASPDLKIREVSYIRYLETMNIAAELDMDYIIFHSQINPYLNHPYLKRINNLQAKAMWEKLLKESKYKGTILIENVFEEEPKILKEYMDAIKIERLKVNLDIGHAKLGKASLEDWIGELKDYISYLHVHSNDGNYDIHSQPSALEIRNLYSILDKYRIDPVIALEYKADNLEEEIKRYF